MKSQRYGLMGVVAAGVLALAVACTSGDSAPTPGGGNSPVNTTGGTGASTALFNEGLASYYSGGVPQVGIHVTGTGTVTVAPDLVRLSLGVEARAATVAAARDEAAAAMSGIIQALKDAGLSDQDIQTRFFNIQPEYTFRDSERLLTGYRVTNSVTALVRDLDGVGELIEAVVVAGGDAIRINGISFTVEEPEQYQDQAREAAVQQALAKAQQFAQLTSVTLGSPIYISEVGGGPVVQDFDGRAFAAEAMPDVVTPIQAGELDIVVRVQAVFDIVS